MRLDPRLAALLLALGGCQTAPHHPAAGDAARAPQATTPEPLVRRPAFTRCELEGFIALTAARNAIVFHDTKESLLAVKGNGPWQRAMIEDLFARIQSGELRNHPAFAALKFYECAEREVLGLPRNEGGAAVCLARLDISFFLSGEREKGRTQDDALARVRAKLSKAPRDVYPDALVAELAPVVYRLPKGEDDYEVRRLVFETCLFPEEWKAWREGQRRAGGP